jgi:pimeloyl-ACP methyl ester carboxylesterase
MHSFYSSPKEKEAILALYQDKLDELAIIYELKKIETTFGDTNIIITGNKENPPLVLLHGSNGCAPVAIEALLGLEQHFRIYAIDVLGQPNMSAEERPSMKDDTYGKWMYEILTRLNLWNAILVGISFGGFISWKALNFDQRRIGKAFLIVPAGIVEGNPLKAIWKVFLPMKLYMWRKKEKYVHRFLNALFTDRDEFAIQFLSKVFLHFEMDFSPIPLIKTEEAAKIKTPMYFIAADGDIIFPGKKLIKRVASIFPNIQKNLLLKNSKHVPSAAGNQQIIEFIKNNHY